MVSGLREPTVQQGFVSVVIISLGNQMISLSMNIWAEGEGCTDVDDTGDDELYSQR